MKAFLLVILLSSGDDVLSLHSSQYNDACRQGSSKAEAVDDRLSLCRWSFDEVHQAQAQLEDKAA